MGWVGGQWKDIFLKSWWKYTKQIGTEIVQNCGREVYACQSVSLSLARQFHSEGLEIYPVYLYFTV